MSTSLRSSISADDAESVFSQERERARSLASGYSLNMADFDTSSCESGDYPRKPSSSYTITTECPTANSPLFSTAVPAEGFSHVIPGQPMCGHTMRPQRGASLWSQWSNAKQEVVSKAFRRTFKGRGILAFFDLETHLACDDCTETFVADLVALMKGQSAWRVEEGQDALQKYHRRRFIWLLRLYIERDRAANRIKDSSMSTAARRALHPWECAGPASKVTNLSKIQRKLPGLSLTEVYILFSDTGCVDPLVQAKEMARSEEMARCAASRRTQFDWLDRLTSVFRRAAWERSYARVRARVVL